MATERKDGHYVAKFSDDGPMGSYKGAQENFGTDVNRGFLLDAYPIVYYVSDSEPAQGEGKRPGASAVGDIVLHTIFDKIAPRSFNSFVNGNVIESIDICEIIDINNAKAIFRQIKAKHVSLVGWYFLHNGITHMPLSSENNILVMVVRASHIEEMVLQISDELSAEGYKAAISDVVNDTTEVG